MILNLDFGFANQYHAFELLPVGTLVKVRTTVGGDPQWWFGMKVSQPETDGAPVFIAGGELPFCETAGTAWCADLIELRSIPVGFQPGEVSDVVVMPDNNARTVQFSTITACRAGRTVFYCDHASGIEPGPCVEVARYDLQSTAEQLMDGFANAARHHQEAA